MGEFLFIICMRCQNIQGIVLRVIDNCANNENIEKKNVLEFSSKFYITVYVR